MTFAARTLFSNVSLSLLLCVIACVPLAANGTDRVSASAGFAGMATSSTDRVWVTVPHNQQKMADKYLPDGATVTKSRSHTLQSSDYSGYWIYDAWAELFFDEDDDGFYAGLDITFDADTDYFATEVYARLYLSLEGGPWILYYTTDVFTLFGDSGDDEYKVETDLIDGYPTGYYDVLIELYDYEYDELVAEFGPYESPDLSALPLEDEAKDIGFITPPAPPVSYSSGGGGSAGLAFLIASLILVLRRRAGATRLG